MATITPVNENLLRKTAITNKLLLNIAMSKSQKSLKDLRGKISFSNDYDYKSMRA